VLRDQTGVTIFFFLSGFLITTLMIKEHEARGRIDLKAFYLRRIFRILPAMYVTLALGVAVSAFGLLPSSMTPLGILAPALQFTNYWIIVAGRDGLPTGLNALWSLAVEEHFYLLFPLVFIAMCRLIPSRRAQIWFLSSLCLMFLAWRLVLVHVMGQDFDRVYLATDTRADSILLGALLAIGWNPVRGNAVFGGPRLAWARLIVGLATLMVVRLASETFALTFGYTVEGIALFLIFSAVISAPDTLFGRLLNWRPIAYLGLISYSLYLVHRLVILLFEQYTHLGTVFTAVASFAVAVGLSVLLHHFVEKPAIALRRHFSNPSPDRR
jgi:peptidoglycan/LPS O-acetylase OafA/YrhL